MCGVGGRELRGLGHPGRFRDFLVGVGDYAVGHGDGSVGGDDGAEDGDGSLADVARSDVARAADASALDATGTEDGSGLDTTTTADANFEDAIAADVSHPEAGSLDSNLSTRATSTPGFSTLAFPRRVPSTRPPSMAARTKPPPTPPKLPTRASTRDPETARHCRRGAGRAPDQ